jgi:hypothetical protein
MSGLARKRQRELDAGAVFQKSMTFAPLPKRQQVDLPEEVHGSGSGVDGKAKFSKPSKQVESIAVPQIMFSASAALTNFMRSMGKSPAESTSVPIITSVIPTVQAAAAAELNAPLFPSATISQPQREKLVTNPAPPIPPNLPTKCFVVSTEFLREHRFLMRTMRRLYCEAIYFERDFSSCPDAIEADILLSPTTGIVLTTLQKIKQRALPGQESKAVGIMGKLFALNARYERIVLFAVDAGKDMLHPRLDERDRVAFNELGEFASTLEADVQIRHAADGEEELAKWIVSLMWKYGTQTDNLQMFEEESFVSIPVSSLRSVETSTDSRIVGAIAPSCWLQCLRCTNHPC